jgi:hypothetical protein
MADLDLDRIISDLRERRARVQQSIEETEAGTAEREQLFITAGKLRERLNGLSARVENGPGGTLEIKKR